MALGRKTPQSFPKSHRLLSKKDYDTVFDNGVKVVCRDFVIVASSAPATPGRLGLVVSKKVGNAVIRNRVKRCLRDSFRCMRDDERLGRDLVVIARPSLMAADGRVKQDIRESFERCLNRMRGQISDLKSIKARTAGTEEK